jgi:hypothetical protein
MHLPTRSLIVVAAVLLGVTQTAWAAKSPRSAQPHHAASARGLDPQAIPWCVQHRTGGLSCGFADFQGCMYAAAAQGGSCTLSPAYRAKYGDATPDYDRWFYGAVPSICFKGDLRCRND